MKGVPDEVMNSKITFNVRPVLSDKGLLKTKLEYPELEQIADSIAYQSPMEKVKLSKNI